MNETCNYLASHNTPCGQPATHSYVTGGRKRLYVCPDHCSQVFRDTKRAGRPVNPTPLVAAAVEHSMLPLTAPVAPVAEVFRPVIPAMPAGKPLSQLYREMQESQSEGSDKP